MSPLPPEVKSIFSSKTFLVNAISLAAAALVGVSDSQWAKDNPNAGFYILGAVNILNVLLRMVTYQAVKFLVMVGVGLLGFATVANAGNGSHVLAAIDWTNLLNNPTVILVICGIGLMLFKNNPMVSKILQLIIDAFTPKNVSMVSPTDKVKHFMALQEACKGCPEAKKPLDELWAHIKPEVKA